MNYRLTTLAILFVIITDLAAGQPVTEKRTFRKGVRVNREMTLEVTNKYGTIHILPSSNDSLNITAEIEASGQNHEKIRKMLEGINVSITEGNYSIIARTEFTQSINMIFEEFKGLTKKFIQYDSRVQINYSISAPSYLNMRIENKYGDVYMEDCSGSLSLTLSNGSFKAGTLQKLHDLNMSFCDATITGVDDASIDADFSEVSVGDAASLKINSISSKFELRHAGKISTDSKRDKFYIGTLSSLKGESYFTDFRIEKLEGDLDISTKYGSLTADMVEKSFRGATINSGYSDITINFDPSISYNLEIRHKNTTLYLPEKNASLEKKTVSEENGEFITFGSVGKAHGTVNVNIDANRGKIYIK
ncbi:MAG TPA: hypothetical protein VMT63_09700 [Bacteroidales bacterium]|nr:hypothetical protein [Bacteroidales bacterium]